MSRGAARHATRIDDGEVLVETDEGPLTVGSLDAIVGLVGGHAWTISYTERQKRRYPDLDTSDEGLTVDVVDVINGMALEESFVTALRRLPAHPGPEGDVPPRTGLFVGRLLGNLETGLE